MLRQLLVVLILYIIINQLILYFSYEELDNVDLKPKTESKSESKSESKTKPLKNKNKSKLEATTTAKSIIPYNMFGEPQEVVPNKYIIWSFNQPVPWSKIIYVYDQEYPFRFFLKIHIPSLNDYQSWKQILSNLDFDSKLGELIIPSKNEESALAIANLIVSNFQGQLTIDTILENNLIQISVTKALQYEVVKTKLREQIIEAINGKSNKFLEKNEVHSNDYEEDLVNKVNMSSDDLVNPSNSDKPENFKNENEPLAYESDNLSYL